MLRKAQSGGEAVVKNTKTDKMCDFVKKLKNLEKSA
jgi:hypothetical protein